MTNQKPTDSSNFSKTSGAKVTAKTRRSIVLIGGFLLVSIIAVILIQMLMPASTDSAVAVVIDSESVEHRFPLNEEGSHTISTSLGENTIEISGGSVKVSHADCANQVCVETGSIDSPGDMIVCLPHELIVTIESSEDDKVSAVDGIDTVSS